jgi:hypothetical protein
LNLAFGKTTCPAALRGGAFFWAELNYDRRRRRRKRMRTSAHEHYGVARLPMERTMPRRNQYQYEGPVVPGSERRPSPPAQLDARERKIWTDITRRLPSDWITAESQPMLKELCRHLRSADDLSVDLALARAAIDEIRKMPEPDAEALAEATREYRAVLRAHGYQTERIGNLSTKLRLTPQARYAPSSAQREAAKVIEGPEPWLDWGEPANRTFAPIEAKVALTYKSLISLPKARL